MAETLTRLQQLEEALGSTRKLAEQTVPADRVKEAETALSGLSGRVAGLESQATDLGNQNRSAMDQLNEKLGKLESRIARRNAGGEDGAQALLMSVGHLRNAIRGSRPFVDELATVVSVSAKDGGDCRECENH